MNASSCIIGTSNPPFPWVRPEPGCKIVEVNAGKARVVLDEVNVFARLDSPIYGALVHGAQVTATAVSADVTAARIFDEVAPVQVYVDAARLGPQACADADVNNWPLRHDSLFEVARQRSLQDAAFKPRQWIDAGDGPLPPIFLAIERHTPIRDSFCISFPLEAEAWCMFAYLRCGEQNGFSAPELQMIERIKPALRRLIKTAYHKQTHAQPRGDAAIPGQPAALLARLSRTEREILQPLLDGQTERQIGQAIHRSPHTVHVHVKNIYRKLGVNSRRQLQSLFPA